MTGEPAWQLDALRAFAGGEPPAFAIDARQRIRFWNQGAERLLQVPAQQALGEPCFDVVRGRDAFGNRFCYENCPLLATQRRGETLRPFALIAPCRDSGGARSLSVTAVQLRAESRESLTLLHILRPSAAPELSVARVQPGRSSPPLTAREQEVLRCIAGGLQNKEIAERLSISPATVRNHVHHLLEKLHVHSKLQAASLAHRCGWCAAD